MEKNSLSVVIPVFNGEKYIDNCISKLIETPSVNEVIVVNDCSTDNSLEVLKKYKNNLRIINLKKNRGVSNARNIGIKKARGNYIAFIDIDDEFETKMYSKMLSKILNSRSDVCICNYDEICNNKTTNSKYDYSCVNGDFLSEYLLDHISPAVWDKVYKTKLIKSIKFNSNLQIGEDILFCLNVFMKTNKVSFVNENLYHYFQISSSTMHNVSNKLLQFEKVVDFIDKKSIKYLKNSYSSEFNYFQTEMILREIHSISSSINKNNFNECYRLLKKCCKKDKIDSILKNTNLSKSNRIELYILKLFGIKFHMRLFPVYKKIREILR